MSRSTYHDGKKMVGRRDVLSVRPDLEDIYDEVEKLFPIRLTRSFADRADLSDPTDPLTLQVLPDARELSEEGLVDPVGEMKASPVPWVIRKYRDRAILMVTKRCHLYCRYCFRRTHSPGESLAPTKQELSAAIDWLAAQRPMLREVILSGGDPLMLGDRALIRIVDSLQALGLRVRVHTRAPITYPARVTSELAAALAKRAVFVVVHTNHVRELAPDVGTALALLVDAGVVVSNQSVLLAGVNDSASVLVELFERLMRLRVRPYYLHHPDEVVGNAHFRVSAEVGRRLYADVKAQIGGMALPRYVWDPPDGSGKRDCDAQTGP